MSRFPNTVKAVAEIVEPLCSNTVRWITDLEGMPLIHIFRLASPGSADSWERQDRLRLDIYAHGLDECETLANRVRDLLAGKPHGTSEGLLDRVLIELEPYPLPYPDESIVQFSLQIRVECRAKN